MLTNPVNCWKLLRAVDTTTWEVIPSVNVRKMRQIGQSAAKLPSNRLKVQRLVKVDPVGYFYGKAIPFRIYRKQEEITMSAGQKFKCLICGKQFKAITNTHLKRHGITSDQYKEKFPEASFGNFDRFDKWRNSVENKRHWANQARKNAKDPELQQRRIESVKKAWNDPMLKKSHSELMTEKVYSNKESYPQLFEANVTEMMKMSNYDRWKLKYGKLEADKRMSDWMKKNKLQTFQSKDTRGERLFEEHVQTLEIRYEKQFHCTPYYPDFYLPEYNLLVEIDGDYWHANPNKWNADDIVGRKGKSAKEIWKRDTKKNAEYSKKGFKVLRIWESELFEKSTQDIFEDIVHASLKDEG